MLSLQNFPVKLHFSRFNESKTPGGFILQKTYLLSL